MVEHFAIFENLVFAITSRTLRIQMEHIESIDSSDSKLQIEYMCSITIFDIFKVIAKSGLQLKLSKNLKIINPGIVY